MSAGGKNMEAPYPRMRKRIASRTYFNGQCPKVNGFEASMIFAICVDSNVVNVIVSDVQRLEL